MISTILHWLGSPPGQVAMGVVLVVVIPAWGWKLWMDAVNPRERERTHINPREDM